MLSGAKHLRLFLSQRLPSVPNWDAAMHEGSCFTYIMASRNHTPYIRVSGDLHKRVFEHEWNEHDGFLARYGCNRSGHHSRVTALPSVTNSNQPETN